MSGGTCLWLAYMHTESIFVRFESLCMLFCVILLLLYNLNLLTLLLVTVVVVLADGLVDFSALFRGFTVLHACFFNFCKNIQQMKKKINRGNVH